MKSVLINLANANRIVDWQDDAMYGYADPQEGTARLSISDAQWAKQNDGIAQGLYNNVVQAWIAPPDPIPDGKEAQWDGTAWVLIDLPPPPPPPVPRSITMRQARLVLLQAGLLGQVNQAIAAMPGDAGEAARIEWEYATSIDRDNPLFGSLASALGLSEQQVDAMFIAGAGL